MSRPTKTARDIIPNITPTKTAQDMIDLMVALTTTQNALEKSEKSYAEEKKTNHTLKKKLDLQDKIIKEMSNSNDRLSQEKQKIALKYNELYNTYTNYFLEISSLKDERNELLNANKRLAATLRHTSDLLAKELAKNINPKKQRTK